MIDKMKKYLLYIFACVIIVPTIGLLLFIALELAHSSWAMNESWIVATVPSYTWNVIPPSYWQAYKYMQETSDKDMEEYYAMWLKYWSMSWFMPQSFLNDKCFRFSYNWIEKRKRIYEYIVKYSKEFWVDGDLVISSIIGEQIRIACSSRRSEVKSMVMNTSPRWLISYDFSLGIWWVKPSTAEYIRNNSIYWPTLSKYSLTEWPMTTDESLMAILPVLLVEHITRTRNITDPWIIGTIYNIGVEKRKPHNNPQVWWVEIKVWWHKVSYWEISAFVYYDRKLKNI